ncbi:inositol monophosphatase family protein, partial [Nostocoides japonicum]|uniref:inositol monophosphatase family protein n=1 Tax=Nostocoides japonicum TaxID=99481 RepID=UPI002E130647
MPSGSELAALGSTALSVTLEAAALVGDRPEDLGVAATKSSRTDVVTVMDQRAQALIRSRLERARPGDAFLGEEEGGTSAPSTTGITWVVDPIDGTVNYLYDIPAYAVSVAAVTGDPTTPGAWRPVAGVVAAPASGEVFRATLGEGAWRRRGDGPWTRIGHSGCDDLGL